MPNWNELLTETQELGSVQDIIRRRYLKKVNTITERNLIIYYSGWLQAGLVPGTYIHDADKNGFMNVIHKLDRSLGLDLMIHTPGGDIAATESIVRYLRSMFNTDIRVIVPQLAMSGGTVIACAASEIIMGKHSSLGPIDPQMNGVPAHGVVEEFNRAITEVQQDQSTIPIWQTIITKYPPAFIGECEKAISWCNEIVLEYLRTGMFADESNSADKIDGIIKELGDHALTKSHSRQLSFDRCSEIGLNVVALEDDQELQDAVLSAHHACMISLSVPDAPVAKIIENHNGAAYVQMLSI